MATASNLFGEEISRDGILKVTLHGGTFDRGEIPINSLYIQLNSLEKIVKYNLRLLADTGKIDRSLANAEIYVHINDGSIAETFRVVFSKESLAGSVMGLLIGLINTTYSHFLNSPDAPANGTAFPAELATIKNDPAIRKELSNLISPIDGEGKSITIQDNHGSITFDIVYPDKQKLIESLNTSEIEDPLRKNGEFEETLTGVIRKIDLDAARGNYLGFNVDSGKVRIPTAIIGEFHLNDYKDLIDKHIKVRAKVNYKNDAITHIVIEKYEILDSQAPLGIENIVQKYD